ncbi:hypothetical protein [Caballeronia sp. ATUFL_M2_KS44]|uniref:hypothetical protein n=1 Tax=Caballeronia sp. ATUFL_M2_KS44 TaxID=2921767 RepID=UPI002028936D|nr:hypothetical protein [Caballeronia sp. ATUFL_M2_KS44]
MKRDGWLIPLCALVFVTLAALCFRFSLTSQDLAAWVQAIGSIGAILAAIWVLHRQHEQDKETEWREVRAFVAAVREELQVTLQNYEHTRKRLLAVADGDFFAFIFPATSEAAFTFYNNASAQVGKIPDADLRRMIVTAYAQAKGLIASYQLNNGMLGQLNSMALDGNDWLEKPRVIALRRSLIGYAVQLKEQDALVVGNIAALISMIDAWPSSRCN